MLLVRCLQPNAALRKEQRQMANPMLKGWTQRSAEEALAEVEREFSVRLKCFPRWVEEGRVHAVDARDRLQRLRLAMELLTRLLKRHESELAELATDISKTYAKTTSGSEINSEKPVDAETPF